jgi:hypothetical protein
MEKKKTAQSWIILGVVFIVLLLVYAGLSTARVIKGSYGFESIISVIGFCGFLFLFVGIIKWFFERRS